MLEMPDWCRRREEKRSRVSKRRGNGKAFLKEDEEG